MGGEAGWPGHLVMMRFVMRSRKAVEDVRWGVMSSGQCSL